VASCAQVVKIDPNKTSHLQEVLVFEELWVKHLRYNFIC